MIVGRSSITNRPHDNGEQLVNFHKIPAFKHKVL